MFCPMCDTDFGEGVHFCNQCGGELVEDTSAYTEAAFDSEHDVSDAYHEPVLSGPASGSAPLRTGKTGAVPNGPSVRFDDDAYADADPHLYSALERSGPHVHVSSVDVDVDFDGISMPDVPPSSAAGFTAPHEEGASGELEAILSQLRHHTDEVEEERRLIHDFEAVTDPSFLLEGDEEDDEQAAAFILGDEDGYQLGGDAIATGHEGFVLGDEDDSGPIPMDPASYNDHVTAPPASRRAKRLTTSRAMAKMDGVQRAAMAALDRVRSIQRRQVVLFLIVAIAVCGVGYAIVSGGDGAAQDDATAEATLATQADAAGEPSSAAASQAAAEVPGYELVALSQGDADDPAYEPAPGKGAPVATPSSNKNAVPYSKQNLLIPNNKRNKSESFTFKRPCVLRDGPASRFPLVSPLDAGKKITILAESEPDWQTQTTGKTTGWTKECKGSDCALRTGPGERFRLVEGGDKTPNPTRRVVSSSKWRYIQFGELYGWAGPVCFK